MPEPVHILVVDDLASQRLTIEAALAELGEHVISVASGRDALKFLLEHEAAVVLLDVNMPEMDGFETAALIRQRPRNADTPIIFLTADTDELHVSRGYALGAVDYVICPFLPDVLRTKVKVFVTLHRARRQIRVEADQRVALSREQAARAAAEEQGRRMRLLGEVGEVLGRSLDGAPIERPLLRALLPVLGDEAGLTLVDGGDEGISTWIEGETGAIAPEDASMTAALRRVMESQSAEILRDEEFGPRCGSVLPLVLHGRAYGALAIRRRKGTGHSEEDSALAALVANRAVIALENRRLFRELQERDRRKDEFLAMLSHELRNPLEAISAGARVLEVDETGDERFVQARRVILRQSRHLARIVDDLLDVSRVTTGRITLAKRPLDLRQSVERTVEALRAAGRFNRHHLEVAAASAPTYADAARMEQVVTNLVVNAIKYTEVGGHIRVTTGSRDGRAFIRVEDDGVGIGPELLPTLFDVFVQGGQDVDRAQGGLGLGLTLVRKLVELQGGQVGAASDGPGKGSVFTIELPLAEPEPIEPAVASATVPVRPLRVLVVDDNNDARDMLRYSLEARGHVVSEAASGPDAVDCARRVLPDVALIDIGLPGFDGHEVARRLRKDVETREIMLVALTGYGQAEDRERSLNAGFRFHLVKPVELERLDQVLAQASRDPSVGAGA